MIPALVAEGFSSSAAANTLSLLAVCGVCSKLVCGWLSEKLTARVTLLGCLALQIAGLCMFVIGSSDALYVASWGVFGLGFGGVGALLPLVCMDTFGHESFGKVYGRMGTGNLVPVIIGPLLAGWSYDETGSYKIAFVIAGGIFFISGICLLLARYVQSRDTEAESCTSSDVDAGKMHGGRCSSDSVHPDLEASDVVNPVLVQSDLKKDPLSYRGCFAN